VHLSRIDLEDHRFAAAGADFSGSVDVRREMDMMPFAFYQPLGHDRGQELLDSAVIQNIRRDFLFQLQINFDAVPLVGADQVARAVEREALLVVGFDAFDEFIVSDGEPGPRARRKQIIHRRPAARLERQTESLRRMTKVLGEELADGDKAAVQCFLLRIKMRGDELLRPQNGLLDDFGVTSDKAIWRPYHEIR